MAGVRVPVSEMSFLTAFWGFWLSRTTLRMILGIGTYGIVERTLNKLSSNRFGLFGGYLAKSMDLIGRWRFFSKVGDNSGVRTNGQTNKETGYCKA